MYQAGDADRAAREADKKALLEAQKMRGQRDREINAAKQEEEEAAFRSKIMEQLEQKNPEFAAARKNLKAWQEAVTAYEHVQKTRSGRPAITKGQYDDYVKNINSTQSMVNRVFKQAVDEARAAEAAQPSQAAQATQPSAPPTATEPAQSETAPQPAPVAQTTEPSPVQSAQPEPPPQAPVVKAPEPVQPTAPVAVAPEPEPPAEEEPQQFSPMGGDDPAAITSNVPAKPPTPISTPSQSMAKAPTPKPPKIEPSKPAPVIGGKFAALKRKLAAVMPFTALRRAQRIGGGEKFDFDALRKAYNTGPYQWLAKSTEQPGKQSVVFQGVDTGLPFSKAGLIAAVKAALAAKASKSGSKSWMGREARAVRRDAKTHGRPPGPSGGVLGD
jgi:hypothetical protein